MEKIPFKDVVALQMERNRGIGEGFEPQGFFKIEIFDKNYKLKSKVDFKNTVVTVGKNYALGASFFAVTPLTSWFLGLIDNSGYTGPVVGDTMASHAGWTEFTGYTSSTRVACTFAAPSAASITNAAAPTQFTINTTGTIRGVFLTSDSTKSGTTGTLWSAAGFSGGASGVVNTDVVRITYTIS